jgi:cyclopropane fatty-acyl-phospholipid synthase-like methyltransferase
LDRYKYSAVSHRDFSYCNPISATKMEGILNLVEEIEPGEQVIDFGAGKGELLLRLIERYQIRATGVERSPYFLKELQERAVKRVAAESLEVLEMDASSYQAEEGLFGLAACIGASEIFGGYKGTLERLKEMVRPGGYVLVGEGYWKHEPDSAYVRAFGVTRDEYHSHADNVMEGTRLNLLPLYAAVCSDDDWDNYEWRHSTAVERYARQNADDPDVPDLLERIRDWRDLYLRWGRDTLGFGVYLFQRT